MTVAGVLAAGSAPVTQWGDRLVLTAVVLLVVGLGLWGMRSGWRGREARQSAVPEPPAPPAVPPTGEPVAGQYVATTAAGDLLDRIVVHRLGNRGRAQLASDATGILITRTGEPTLWIPSGSVTGVRLGSGQAQRAFERGGVILITWRLGDALVDTGFRADDPDQHVAAAQELTLLAPNPGGAR